MNGVLHHSSTQTTMPLVMLAVKKVSVMKVYFNICALFLFAELNTKAFKRNQTISNVIWMRTDAKESPALSPRNESDEWPSKACGVRNLKARCKQWARKYKSKPEHSQIGQLTRCNKRHCNKRCLRAPILHWKTNWIGPPRGRSFGKRSRTRPCTNQTYRQGLCVSQQ